MKRNALLGVALAAVVAFTVLVHNANDHQGGSARSGGPQMTLPGQPQSGQPGAAGHGGPGQRNGQPNGQPATVPAGQSGGTASGQQTRPPGAGRPGSGGTPGAVDPDSFFTPTKLRPGEKPPQFVIVSFDGVGSHEKWEYWKNVAEQANMRFTGFLSGVYLLSTDHKRVYHGPGHNPGASSIGFSADLAKVRQEVLDLNDAWRRGYEIGTHYNGHFCSGNGYAGASWTTADWTSELQQFFNFYRYYRTVNADPTLPALQIPVNAIKGGRTPCLEGRMNQLMPALRHFNFGYDSSGNRNGIAWPSKNQYGIWEFPMAYVPMAGRNSGVISMDYNFWVKQTGNPPTAGDSIADSNQVVATYQQMYQAAYTGNRAPLVLGNHFNSWNNNAYTQALATFVTTTCRKPNTYCLPYRDVIRWMAVQDPAVLNRLQQLPAVDTVP
jgi:hypothetical protein